MSLTSMPPADTGVPPLREGDRLTREEFHRRYLAMPAVKKAELIEGVVHMPSPVRSDVHATPHGFLVSWLGVYLSQTPGTRFGDNGTVRLAGPNEVQPDAYLMIERSHGGGAELDSDGFVTGGPELVAEVAASTVSRDRNEKLRLYRANGVCEHLIWRTADGEVDWFILREGRYDALPLNGGVYSSIVFPGLWLDQQAMLGGDLAGVLATLARGLASPEHAAFVTRLRSAARS